MQDYRGLTVEQATQRAYDIGDLEEAQLEQKFNPNDTVKSCYKLESGLRLGQEGIHACQLGPFSSPIFFTENEASQRKITKTTSSARENGFSIF